MYIYICINKCQLQTSFYSSSLIQAAIKFTLLLQTRPVPRTRSAAIILRQVGMIHDPLEIMGKTGEKTRKT